MNHKDIHNEIHALMDSLHLEGVEVIGESAPSNGAFYSNIRLRTDDDKSISIVILTLREGDKQ